MADRTQIGSPQGGPKLRCPEAEPLFTGYIDGALDAPARERLELHLRECSACAAEFKLAERGAAWLKILRHEDAQLQPPAGLVDKILARTAASELGSPVPAAQRRPLLAARPWTNVNLAAVRANLQRSGLLEPRLMLTAAMAFFSISLTLNVLGIRLNDLRPMNLRHTVTRTYTDTSAHVMRYYDNMRVVYQLESRVRELRRAAEATDNNRSRQPEPSSKSRQDKSQSNGNPGSSSSGSPADGVAGKSHGKKKAAAGPAPVTGDVLEARLNFALPSIERSLV